MADSTQQRSLEGEADGVASMVAWAGARGAQDALTQLGYDTSRTADF